MKNRLIATIGLSLGIILSIFGYLIAIDLSVLNGICSMFSVLLCIFLLVVIQKTRYNILISLITLFVLIGIQFIEQLIQFLRISKTILGNKFIVFTQIVPHAFILLGGIFILLALSYLLSKSVIKKSNRY